MATTEELRQRTRREAQGVELLRSQQERDPIRFQQQIEPIKIKEEAEPVKMVKKKVVVNYKAAFDTAKNHWLRGMAGAYLFHMSRSRTDPQQAAIYDYVKELRKQTKIGNISPGRSKGSLLAKMEFKASKLNIKIPIVPEIQKPTSFKLTPTKSFIGPVRKPKKEGGLSIRPTRMNKDSFIKSLVSRYKDTGFGKEAKHRGFFTTLTEKTGDITLIGFKEKQKRKDIISGFVSDKLGTSEIPTKQKIKDEILAKALGVSPEAIKKAKEESAKTIGSIAPYLIPIAGPGIAIAQVGESYTTKGGKESTRNLKKWLKEKGMPQSLAHAPNVLLGVGGAAALRGEIRAINRLSKVGKEGEAVITNSFSPNVKDVQIQKVLQNLDSITLKSITKNKLSAARVYETKTGGRTIQFVEFAKGGSVGEGFAGTRLIYGVELGKGGKVVKRIGGITIEKTGADKVSRSITELIISSRKRGRFTVTPREERELLRISQESKATTTPFQSKDTTLPTFLTTTEAEASLISKVKLKKGEKKKLTAKDEIEFLAFLTAGKKKLGKPITKTKGQVTGIDMKLGLGYFPKTKGGVKLIKKEIETKGIEKSRFITNLIKQEEKLKGLSGKQKIKMEIAQTRKDLPFNLKKSFDKMSQIEKNFYAGQRIQNRINKLAGVSKSRLKMKVKTEKIKADIFFKTEQAKIKTRPITPKQLPSDIASIYAAVTKTTKKEIQIPKKALDVGGKLGMISGSEIKKALESSSKTLQITKKDILKESFKDTEKDILKEKVSLSESIKKSMKIPRTQYRLISKIKIQKSYQQPISPRIRPIKKQKGLEPLETIKKPKKKPVRLTPKKQFYMPLAKRNNKWVKLSGTGMLKQAAEGRGARAVDNTIAGRFKIVKVAKGDPKLIDNYMSYNKRKFRDYKIVKGEKIPVVDKFFERRGVARIDTPGEKKGLTLAKIIKQNDWLGKKKKKRRMKDRRANRKKQRRNLR